MSRWPPDPAWEELGDEGAIWARIGEELGFAPTIRSEHWPSFREPAGSITWEIGYLLHAIPPGDPDLDADREAAATLRAGLIAVMGDDDHVLALDWQHPCYRFRPALGSDDPATWRVPALPDGDYFLFVAPDLRFGWLTHPWETSLCVYGDLLPHVRPLLDRTPNPILRRDGHPVEGD